jgi:NAD(P)-dependent dehydrogenase (short-subunit alcohol dehydrogenase family)
MASEFENKVVLITGAGQGMGRAVAVTFGQQEAQIAINDVNAHSAEATSSALGTEGVNAIAVAADITDKIAVEAMVQKTIHHFGRIDILINNAGILYPTKVEDINEEEWDRVIDVNLKGTFLCSQAVLPAMQKNNWGRIVNFSSTAGKNITTVGGAHYTAAKAGILGFTRHLAKEVAPYHITVNAVCPGLIDTDMVRNTIGPDRRQAYADSFPISRLGKPEEVADLVAFLCSDKASYITGASLDINGGDLMI